MSLVTYVFAQTDNKNANSKKSLVIQPEMVSEFVDHTKSVSQALASSDQENIGREAMAMTTEITKSISDQENISREAMAMILDITKSNILYEKNKSSSNLALEEQKIKDREKNKKEMKEYNERYNKKYLASYKRLQKMRGQHAGYSGVHSDYSAYLQQFLASTSR